MTAAETDQNGDPVLTEGGASITATATITNGVTFASAQTVTLAWGDASLTSEYVVGAGNATAISIAAGQASGSLTISSPDTDTTPSYTPPKEHDLTATHAGTEIGSVKLIRLDDEQPPVATIAAVPTTVTEGEDIAIEVRLNLPFDGARFVSFDVTDADSALSGTKVRFNSVFGYRDTIKTITFSADDNSIQNDGVRTATVALYRDASRDYTLGDPSSVVVTVLDNDSPPTAPRNLTATAISETRIDLTWEEPVKTSGLPITGYRIEVSTDDSNWSNLAGRHGVDGHRLRAHGADGKHHALLPGLGDQRHRHGQRLGRRLCDHPQGSLRADGERRRVHDAAGSGHDRRIDGAWRGFVGQHRHGVLPARRGQVRRP